MTNQPEQTTMSTVKPRKTEILKMCFLVVSPHFTDKRSILALQNAPIAFFCDASMLHLAIACLYNQV